MKKVQVLKGDDLLVLKEALKKEREWYDNYGPTIRELYLKGELNDEDLQWMMFVERKYYYNDVDIDMIIYVMDMTIKEFIEYVVERIDKDDVDPTCDYNFELSKSRLNKWMRLCK